MENSQKWLLYSFMGKIINTHKQTQTMKHLKASSYPHSPCGLRTEYRDMPGALTPHHWFPHTALLLTPDLWPERRSHIQWEDNSSGSTPTLQNEVMNTNAALINRHCFVWATSSHQHPKSNSNLVQMPTPWRTHPTFSTFPHSRKMTVGHEKEHLWCRGTHESPAIPHERSFSKRINQPVQINCEGKCPGEA